MRYEVFESAPHSDAEGELADGTGYLPGHAAQGEVIFVRRVRYYYKEHIREFVFLSNYLQMPRETVTALYQDRWQIETFFRTLKQNLYIESCVGTSENSLEAQIYSAHVSMMLIAYMPHCAR
jgi:transposase